MEKRNSQAEEKKGVLRGYDLFMSLLILYVIVELALEIIVDFSSETLFILSRIDLIICIIFIVDWFYFLIKSDQRRIYIRKRWIELFASIPFTQILRPLRIFRLVRIIRSFRLIRGLKAVSPLIRFLFKSKSRSALSIYLILTLFIYFYCSLGMYNFESGVNDGIHSFSDVLWMSFTTLTSVGYGDIYPVTGGGRIMAAILVLTGMGLFSLLTAEFASLIISFAKRERFDSTEI